jgi:molecular chaperone Hsp33
LAVALSFCRLLGLGCPKQAFAKIATPRLFNEEQVRLFSAEPISFKCRCSAEKVATTLISLGRETVDEILAEQGEVIADCEFCSSKYHFDTVDIARIFSKSPVHPDSKTQH